MPEGDLSYISVLLSALVAEGMIKALLNVHNDWGRCNKHDWSVQNYRGADKSLARPGRKQATATEDFVFHVSYL